MLEFRTGLVLNERAFVGSVMNLPVEAGRGPPFDSQRSSLGYECRVRIFTADSFRDTLERRCKHALDLNSWLKLLKWEWLCEVITR